MSDPTPPISPSTPPQRLDYAGPHPREGRFGRGDRDFTGGMFAVGFLLGLVLSAVLLPAIAFAMNAITHNWEIGRAFVLVGAMIISEVAIALLIDRRCIDRGLIAGLLTFFGLCLLLVGGCFCLFAASYH